MNQTIVPSSSPEERLASLGIHLPPPPQPVANFVAARRVGPFLYLSGQGPLEAGGHLHTGVVGEGVSIAQAYAHARLTGLNLLAVARNALGDLGRVRSVVKLLAFVNGAPGFAQHPQVINGCSDLFVEVFGETAGRGARSAIGAGSLPGNQTVEIEAILEVE
ncbi:MULTISPECIES: RidA family protein [Comamonadaceae]|uniref:RidA family protein n=1 Tax=Acidovorax sacchari TaxID=3230736 RepID=UPI0034A5C363